MKITDIQCHVVIDPEYNADACSSAQDDIVVLVHTDEGITGIGETDTDPVVAKAMIETRGTHCMAVGLGEMLIGRDPLQAEMLWDMMYERSCMTGRRGLGICAMGAIDMALWDIRGKAMGKPVWQLLGGSNKTYVTPYASLLPIGNTLDEYRTSLLAKARQVRELGFRAAKVEICINGPYSHNNLQESDRDVVELVAACREALGTEMNMMVDVAYAWADVKSALWVCDRIQPYDVFFLETPLRVDDLDGTRRLAERTPIRLAAGEWLQTRWEFYDLIDRGAIDVAQPDVGRVGGLTEARRVADIARDRGRLLVPHCWKSGIGIAASVHLAAVSPHCPYIEFLPAHLSDSKIRAELLSAEPTVDADGRIPLPTQPGLGIELNYDALEKYRMTS